MRRAPPAAAASTTSRAWSASSPPSPPSRALCLLLQLDKTTSTNGLQPVTVNCALLCPNVRNAGSCASPSSPASAASSLRPSAPRHVLSQPRRQVRRRVYSQKHAGKMRRKALRNAGRWWRGLRAARRDLNTPPRALQTPNCFKAAVAFACPCAAARRYHRMASALSGATPRPSANMLPKLF